MSHISVKTLGAFGGLFLLVTLGVAACGSTGGGGGGGGGYGGYGGGGSSSSSSSGGVNLQCGSGATVCTKTVSASGKSVTALADSSGMTLYYFTPDSATTATCSGSCAATWPPLKAGASVTGSGLSGQLTTLNSANGAQVAYNGHPLYLYSGDSSQSDAKGDGILGKWFVATSSLAAANAASASPTSNGYGAGYGAP